MHVQFKGKITEYNGKRYVTIPALNRSHMTERDNMETDLSIHGRAELLRLTGLTELNHPRLTHVSGDFIGTFRADIGTHKNLRAARDVKERLWKEWDAMPRESRGSLLDYEDRMFAAVLECFV